MPSDTPNLNPAHRMDMSQPMPPEAAEFARKVHGMLDGRPKDDATVARALEGMEGMFDMIAAGLYSMASMLVGEGEDSVRLVESAVANAEVSSCTEPEQGRLSSRRALSEAAIQLLAERNPASLAAPEGLEHAETCIEDDDLEAAGVSREELERMMAGPDRERVREWLESLPTAMRTIFVLRGVAGYSAADTAQLLACHGGPRAAGWSAEAVRELFRQGLCSLASQMIHAGTRE
ncbi:MAG TPA: hypothetical protein VKB38_04000 [Terracidiphilus sp.]|nr:hypothetical protein [Terracidiphilus sp.]